MAAPDLWALAGAARAALRHADGFLTAQERLSALFDAPVEGSGWAVAGVDGEIAGIAARAVSFGGAPDDVETGLAGLASLLDGDARPLVLLLDDFFLPADAGTDVLASLGAFVGKLAGHRSFPVVAIVLGRVEGPLATLASLADIRLFVEGSSLSATSPAIVEAVTGEVAKPAEIGSARAHLEATGLADRLFDSELEAILAARYLPALLGSPASKTTAPLECGVGAGPLMLSGAPLPGRELLAALLDGGHVHDLQVGHGKALAAGLGRIGGRPVALLASDPVSEQGLNAAALRKAARLAILCRAANLPLVMLLDTPGLAPECARSPDLLEAEASLLSALRPGMALCLVVTGTAFAQPAMLVAAASHARRLTWRAARVAFVDAEKTDNPAAAGLADAVIAPAETRQALSRFIVAAAEGPGHKPG